MHNTDFFEAVNDIHTKDDRYQPEAYFFVREALDYSIKTLKKPKDGPERHISGQELVQGIRQYALEQFGPMTVTVFKSFGITSCQDFGEIVFNLVECGKLGKTEEDTKDDFRNGYDFHEAFVLPFLPPSQKPSTTDSKPRRRSTPDPRKQKPNDKRNSSDK